MCPRRGERFERAHAAFFRRGILFGRFSDAWCDHIIFLEATSSNQAITSSDEARTPERKQEQIPRQKRTRNDRAWLMGEAAERWKEIQTTRGSPDKEGCGKGKRKVKSLTSEEVSYIKSTATAGPSIFRPRCALFPRLD